MIATSKGEIIPFEKPGCARAVVVSAENPLVTTVILELDAGKQCAAVSMCRVDINVPVQNPTSDSTPATSIGRASHSLPPAMSRLVHGSALSLEPPPHPCRVNPATNRTILAKLLIVRPTLMMYSILLQYFLLSRDSRVFILRPPDLSHEIKLYSDSKFLSDSTA